MHKPSLGRTPPKSDPPPLSSLAAAALWLLIITGSAHAQTILGTTSSTEGEQLGGVFVQLLDANRRPVVARLSDKEGRFLLAGPRPGEYRIRAELIGHDPVELGPFAVGAGDVLVRELRLTPVAIGLQAIEVVAERRCRTRADTDPDLRPLWEEARRTLRLSAWSARELMEFDVVLYERDLDTDLQLRSHQREDRTGFGARPFETLEPDVLRDHGYTRSDSSGTTYYAPDEEVLLSDTFVDTHCFQARRGSDDTAGLLGLSFRPVRTSENVDIQGTLWLDPVTSELRFLEYRYVGKGLPFRTAEAGGRLDFERLTGGATIIRRWRIRVPVAAAPGSSGTRWFGRGRPVLTGFREYGAEVVTVRERHREARLARRSGVISGVVRGPAGEPLGGAVVYLSGSSHATPADEAGRFVLEAPPGRHELAVDHPLLRRLDAYGAAMVLEVAPDQVVSAVAPIAPIPTILARRCPDAPGASLVYGRVTRLDEPAVGQSVVVEVRSEPPPGEARAPSPEAAPVAVTSRTDGEGWYVACGVPPGRGLRVSAKARGGASGAARGELPDDPALARVDVQLGREAVAGLTPPDSVVTMEPIVASVTPRGLFGLEGFHRRKEQGIGRFIDRDDIERRKPVRVTDLLREVPGLRLLCDLGSCKVQFERAKPPIQGGDCPVLYFVDGTPLPMTFPDQYLFPGEIEGIEVHTTATVPAQFNRMVGSPDTGSPRCGVILIWTRWR